jgi:hypothetical protein
MRAVDDATRLLTTFPDALVRADARPPALLALAPSALALADASAPALLAALLWRLCGQRPEPPHSLQICSALAISALVQAHLAFAPLALVLTDARAPALHASAPPRWCGQIASGGCDDAAEPQTI